MSNLGYAKVGANAPCPCESGKKYKKCCKRADRHRPVIRGHFDPDLPVAPKEGKAGNWQARDGSWYVVRAGHGLGGTPELKGERRDRAARMIAEWHESKRKRRGKGQVAALIGTLLAATWGAKS